MRSILLCLFLLCAGWSFGQTQKASICATLPQTGLTATIGGLPAAASKMGNETVLRLNVRREDLAGGFRILLPDKTAKILGFRVYYFGVNSDLYYKDVAGDKATPEQVLALKGIMAGEWIEVRCIVVQSKGKSYHALPIVANVE